MRKRILSLLVLLMTAATGAWAQTYKVSVKEGTEDAEKWTIAPPEATTTGVAQGTTVTATYSGTKMVKSVKAGGLCLALKGVPVKPTDDVDVDKEYQLIPLDSL